MKNKIRKIKSLAKILIKDNYSAFNIFKFDRKLNKKSIYLWILVLISSVVFLFSYNLINWLNTQNLLEEFFLPLYLVGLFFIIYFQISMSIVDVLFFSRDIEKIIVYPYKADEIIIAKCIYALFPVYIMECIFGIIPMLIYSSFIATSITYYFLALLVLIILPIIILLFENILAIILMKILRWIRNRNILQFLILAIMDLPILFLLTKYQNYNSEGIYNLINCLLIVNPALNILDVNATLYTIIDNFVILLGLGMIFAGIVITLGKIFYLKIIINCNNKGGKKDIRTNTKKFNKIKFATVTKTYITKEIKDLFKNTIFLIKCFLPIVFFLDIMIMIIFYIIPGIDVTIQDGNTISEIFRSIPIDIKNLNIMLCVLQVMFSLIPLSLTAISRKGKEAVLMKYIPIDYYKQFIYNNVLQVVVSFFVTIIYMICLYHLMPQIGMSTIILLFILATIINVINSFIMLVLDFRNPNINWETKRCGSV